MGDASAGDRAATPPAVLYKTIVRPHPVSHFESVTVVAIDLRHVALHLTAGTDEPEATGPPQELRTGLVAPEHQETVLAVFNGGYLTRHGRWGMMLDGRTFVPPRKEGCTIALYEDGRVRIAAWPALEETQGQMTGFRQTPPCLVENGEVHPHLVARKLKAWGGQHPDRKTRRRSAVGIDATGRVLFYGLGTEVEPDRLADGLRIAGAVAAAQLDINWNWTRFLLIGRPSPEADLRVTSTLAPNMPHGRSEYVRRPNQRDFFYLTRR